MPRKTCLKYNYILISNFIEKNGFFNNFYFYKDGEPPVYGAAFMHSWQLGGLFTPLVSPSPILCSGAAPCQ
jgi:hypothetical protein